MLKYARMNGFVTRALTLALFAVSSAAGRAVEPTAGQAAEPLRTTAAIRALSATDLQERRPVRLTGQVVAELQPGGFIIMDTTGGFIFDSLVTATPKVGDLITLEAQTFLHAAYRQGYLRPSAVTVTGHAPLPTPRPTDAARIASGAENFNLVTVAGFVSEVVKDENHGDWNWMVLRDRTGNFVYVSVPNAGTTNLTLASLVDAEVAVTGVGLPDYAAERLFIGPHLETWSRDCIRVMVDSPADPFDAPYLSDIHHASPQGLVRLRRHRIVGRVLAAWRTNRFLAREDTGRLIEVGLADGQRQPRAGARVEAVGFPGTDLFRLSLSRALCRTLPAPPSDGCEPPPQEVSADQIVNGTHGHRLLRQSFHGQVVRLRGTIRHLPSPGSGDLRLNLDCDGFLVPVDATAVPDATSGLSIGCRIEVTGVCIMETDKWSPTNLFPVFGGFTLVPRTAADMRVLSRPSWWTPRRLCAVICSLLVALVAIFGWNRILTRRILRRSQQLFREQVAHASAALKIGERTRLAVELHDSLSQNLAGLACQVSAAKGAVAISPSETARHLDTAEKMLLSSRTELRRCLLDLRGDALDLADMTEAVTKTVRPVVGKAALSVRFDVPRRRLVDSTAHSILCIVRELAANAVRHGHATSIRIVGECRDRQVTFTVQDNGGGFEVDRCPGLEDGHFGLTGIRERVRRLDGTFALASDADGTTARVIFHLHPAAKAGTGTT